MRPTKRVFDVRTPMRDGVELSSDIWLPDGEQKHPLILLRTAYLKSTPSSPAVPLDYPKLANFFASKGYAVAVQDVRGRGDSDGAYGYYFQEGNDGYDTIEWFAAQPWCDGHVGTMGASYLGFVQWLAARQRPPHLKCMAIAASPGDFMNELPCVGGAFLQNRLWWANMVSGRIFQANVRNEDWAEIFRHRPLSTADEAMGRKLPLYREWLAHDTLDAYWKRLRLTPNDYEVIALPALHITGWFDSAQAGALYHWQGMAQSSPASDQQFLIIGPWDHVQTFTGGAPKVGELELTADATVDVLQTHLEFFDKYLKGTADFHRPRARIYVTGNNEWRAFGAYPPTDAAPHRLYLSSDGNANSLDGDGRLRDSIPVQEQPDRFLFDPKDPVPLDPFEIRAIHGVDRRPLEQRYDVLVYSSDPLPEAVEVIGRVEVELYAASDAPDTDFTASLIDVYPDGRAVVLGPKVAGIIRARYRLSLERAELLTPGRIEHYRIDLGHVAHCFLPAHRIRLEISSSAAPMYNPNQNTGHSIATDTEWHIAHQTIYHDAGRPSALVMPVFTQPLGVHSCPERQR